MKFSKSFIFTEKATSGETESISHDLSLRAGLVWQVAAGHYDFLPLGARVLRNIERIVREEMEAAGALEVVLPIVQPAELWQESGRWDVYGEEMFKLTNRSGRQFCLGPTHEEIMVELVRGKIESYKSLPFTLFQIGRKFRDELRARSGLLRCKEFLMKDAYSFDATEDGLSESYQLMREAYIRILDRTGISAIPVSAATGEMGGQSSEEFMAPSPAGEDGFVIDGEGIPRKANEATVEGGNVETAIEVGHIFDLGTRYSEPMGLLYTDRDGHRKPIVMGCYGIGISRMLAAIVEQHHDDKGIIWPRETAPFETVIIPIAYHDPEIREQSDGLYAELQRLGVSVLLDDRDASGGAKLRDADLLGMPKKVIVGKRSISDGLFELENRTDSQKQRLCFADIVAAHIETE